MTIASSIAGGRFNLWHGYNETIRFLIANGSGATAATLRIAAGPGALPINVDLVLSTTSAGITIQDVSLDCQVDCSFANLSQTIPVGPRYFELALTKGGISKPVKTGTVMIHPSLAG